MEVVRFDAQERVDLPDMTQVSMLVLAEFRRTVRGLLLGPDATTPTAATNYIIRGYKVEASSSPDSKINVRLNPGGGSPLSFAIGAENLGARVDFGQLMGGDGMDGSLEGNANTTLDFAAQPTGTYTVQARFVYTDGANDNRAFWDEGAVSEFVTTTDTRDLPALELRLSGSPSAEWITLANVVWGGSTIAAGNITDLRTFTVEGAAPFQKTAQAVATGIPDFSRSTDRATNGLNEVYPALRALARQVQDIKGQSDAGTFDWYSRPYRPADPAATLTAGRTKSMRTIDTVTYTVGDGVTDFGDFNGASGINDCLDFIATIPAASLPSRIVIKIKGGGVTYTWATQKSINPTSHTCAIIIEGAVDGGNVANVRARPSISMAGSTLSANQYMLTLSGTGSSIELRRINVTMTGASGTTGMFACDGPIIAEDCSIQMASPDVGALYVLSSHDAGRTFISHCDISGRIQAYNTGSSSNAPARSTSGVIENCVITNAQIVLHADSALGATTPDMVNGFVVRSCIITGRASAIYSTPPTSTTGSYAVIDARSAQALRIYDNVISYGTNENAVDTRTYNSRKAQDVRIVGNIITDATGNGAAHGTGSGNSGAAGTGWGLSIANCYGLRIEGNHYEITNSIDAGAILLSAVARFAVRDEDHAASGHGASGVYQGIMITGTGSIYGEIDGVTWSNWNASMTNLKIINVDTGSRITISSCNFNGYTSEDSSGTAVQLASTYQVIRLGAAAYCTRIRDCMFDGWSFNTANSRTINFDGSSTDTVIAGCQFHDCGGFSVIRTTGAPAGVVIDHCTHRASTGTSMGLADLQNMFIPMCMNCHGVNESLSSHTWIIIGAVGTTVMGNTSRQGNIQKILTPANVRGYNEPGQDLNNVAGYI